jgi:uncharacterized protein YcfJ
MSSKILSVVAVAGLGLGGSLAQAGDWRHDPGRGYRNAGPAVDVARVVAVEPLVERVRYRAPVEECYDVERVDRGPDRTGATIAGGLLGAVIGHQIGSGSGRRAATVAGAVIGGAIGNNASARSDRGYDRVSYETQCHVRDEARVEERIRAYRVTYRYHGRQYTTEMPYDPGPRLRVAVDARPL